MNSNYILYIARLFIFSIFGSVNVSTGETEERMMMTGMHTVADIFCVGCGAIVGWTYVRSGCSDFKMMA